MNVVVVGLIRNILNGLTDTISKEKWLSEELQKELSTKLSLNYEIRKSEKDYKTLFYHSPSPKFIFDLETLKFLSVNNAAARTYGYTEEEFLSMKLTDLQEKEDLSALLLPLNNEEKEAHLKPVTSKHYGKNGKVIHVEISRNDVEYKDKNARMMTAVDITQNLKQMASIQTQNDKLKEIAYLQSHVIRLPLTQIMGLSEIIVREYKDKIDFKILDYLDTSTKQLDSVIKEIVNKSSETLAEFTEVNKLGNEINTDSNQAATASNPL